MKRALHCCIALIFFLSCESTYQQSTNHELCTTLQKVFYQGNCVKYNHALFVDYHTIMNNNCTAAAGCIAVIYRKCGLFSRSKSRRSRHCVCLQGHARSLSQVMNSSAPCHKIKVRRIRVKQESRDTIRVRWHVPAPLLGQISVTVACSSSYRTPSKRIEEPRNYHRNENIVDKSSKDLTGFQKININNNRTQRERQIVMKVTFATAATFSRLHGDTLYTITVQPRHINDALPVTTFIFALLSQKKNNETILEFLSSTESTEISSKVPHAVESHNKQKSLNRQSNNTVENRHLDSSNVFKLRTAMESHNRDTRLLFVKSFLPPLCVLILLSYVARRLYRSQARRGDAIKKYWIIKEEQHQNGR